VVDQCLELPSRRVKKRSSEHRLPRKKRSRILRPYESKLELLDMRFTSFPLEPPDTDSIYMVEDYISPPPPSSSSSFDATIYHCMKCMKEVKIDDLEKTAHVQLLCQSCMDKLAVPSVNRILKVDTEIPEYYYVLERRNQWYARIQQKFRWRWRVKGLIS
jgi:hypothetical protein